MDATSLPASGSPQTALLLTTASFDDLYRAEYDGLVRLAYLLVDTQSEAEEVVQEAFAKLLARWSNVQNPGGYLRRSVLNGGRDLQRRRSTRRGYVAERPALVEPGGDHVLDAVRGLSHRQRAVIVLRFYEDLTVDQIADVLTIRPGTVKSLLHRALKELEKVVER